MMANPKSDKGTQKKGVRGKRIPLDTYLRSLIRTRKCKEHHVPGMRAFAGKRRVATREQWDALFKEY